MSVPRLVRLAAHATKGLSPESSARAGGDPVATRAPVAEPAYLAGTTTLEKVAPPSVEWITAISVLSDTRRPGGKPGRLATFCLRKLTKMAPFFPTAILGWKAWTWV